MEKEGGYCNNGSSKLLASCSGCSWVKFAIVVIHLHYTDIDRPEPSQISSLKAAGRLNNTNQLLWGSDDVVRLLHFPFVLLLDKNEDSFKSWQEVLILRIDARYFVEIHVDAVTTLHLGGLPPSPGYCLKWMRFYKTNCDDVWSSSSSEVTALSLHGSPKICTWHQHQQIALFISTLL